MPSFPDISARLSPATSDSPAPTPKVGRQYFVDLLRLLASFQMVHGHTLDALMGQELRSGVVFERWSWGRGLVSVAFMLAAGLSFHLSTLARFSAHRADPKSIRKRFSRGLLLIAIGYLMHFPAGAMSADPMVVTAAWRSFQIADVLQCIGLSIIALEALTLALPTARSVGIASLVLATLSFALAPLGDRIVPEGMFAFVTNYVSHRGGSLFPLLPWAGYVFSGAAIGQILLPKTIGDGEPPFRLPLRLGIVAAGVFLVSMALEYSPLPWISDETSRNAIPSFNLLKLSAVIVIMAALAGLSRPLKRLPNILRILSTESLALYVSHLLVLYGAGIGLAHSVGPSLSLPQSLVVALVMLVSTALFGVGWHRLKKWWSRFDGKSRAVFASRRKALR